MKKRFLGPALFWIILGIFAVGISVSFASLTFNGVSIFGTTSSTLDSAGTLNLGTASATAINLGSPSSAVSVLGNLTVSSTASNNFLNVQYAGTSTATFASSVTTFYTNPSATTSLSGWLPVLEFKNYASASTSITEFTLNVDNQFEIETFQNSTVASWLDIDANGTVGLFANDGGGIATDLDGDTCLVTTLRSGSTCVVATGTLEYGVNGLLQDYSGTGLQGNGMASILYATDAPLTGSFGPYTIYTTNGPNVYYAKNGLYELDYYITETATSSGATMQFQLGYTDDSGITQTQTSGSSTSFGNRGSHMSGVFQFYSATSSAITVQWITTNSPGYTAHIRLLEL